MPVSKQAQAVGSKRMAYKPAVSLKGKALRSLAQREHSRAELEAKLLRHLAQARSREQRNAVLEANMADMANMAGMAGTDNPPDAAEQRATDRGLIAHTLDELAAAGFQSDERTAASLVRAKGARYGGLALKQRLQAKGLPSELVAQALTEARTTELSRALELWRRRFGEVSTDPQQQAKQARFLAARGFDSAVVRRVVRGWAIDD